MLELGYLRGRHRKHYCALQAVAPQLPGLVGSGSRFNDASISFIKTQTWSFTKAVPDKTPSRLNFHLPLASFLNKEGSRLQHQRKFQSLQLKFRCFGCIAAANRQ